MKKYLLMAVVALTWMAATGQRKANLTNKQKEEAIKAGIIREGKLLYRSEMASWYGSTIFLSETYKSREFIGGYFSYTKNDTSRCIYYSHDEQPRVIGAISFERTYSPDQTITSLKEREFSPLERQLYAICSRAQQLLETDSFFTFYRNTAYNLVPLISEGQRKVYVFTKSRQEGTLILGNDYLLTFDSKNQLLNKKRIHKAATIMRFNIGEQPDTLFTGGAHSHVVEDGEFITPTDICTLMLHEQFNNWKQHYVISKDHINVWDCHTNELSVFTREEWEALHGN